MNLDHDFVQVWKFSEDQRKKCKWNIFSPRIQVKTKKKRSSSQIELFFPQIFALMQTHLKYWGDADMWTILKLLRGKQPNYWGGYIPPSPQGFGTPAYSTLERIILK